MHNMMNAFMLMLARCGCVESQFNNNNNDCANP